MKYIYIAFVSLLLTACSTPKPATVYINKYEFITPPVELTKTCLIPPPFNKEDYLSATPIGKDIMFTNLVVGQYTAMGICNIQLASLRDWVVKQNEVFNKGNK